MWCKLSDYTKYPRKRQYSLSVKTNLTSLKKNWWIRNHLIQGCCFLLENKLVCEMCRIPNDSLQASCILVCWTCLASLASTRFRILIMPNHWSMSCSVIGKLSRNRFRSIRLTMSAESLVLGKATEHSSFIRQINSCRFMLEQIYNRLFPIWCILK